VECWNIGKMGLDLRLAELTLPAGSGPGEDTTILGKSSAEGGTNIKFKMNDIPSKPTIPFLHDGGRT
jgi:hypothetical protein